MRRAQTTAEKILARASGHDFVVPNEIIEVTPDFSYSHDYAVFAIDAFEQMGGSASSRLNATRYVSITDFRSTPPVMQTITSGSANSPKNTTFLLFSRAERGLHIRS